MNRAVLFDLDGVLVDSRKAITTCLNEALEAVGAARRPAEELYGYIGPALADAFAELLNEPRDSQRTVEAVAAYRASYGEVSIRETTLVPGIEPVLDGLTAHRLAVATSKPVAFAEPILETLGIRHHFETVAGPDLNPFGETKATTIARALKTVGRPAVMIGDRRHDVEGAHANGLPCIGVLWGIGGEAELRAAGASQFAREPGDLIGMI